MRTFHFGASIVVGVGLAAMVASSALAGPYDHDRRHQLAQASPRDRLIACTRESQVKVVGNRATLTQERDVYVRRCMGIQ